MKETMIKKVGIFRNKTPMEEASCHHQGAEGADTRT